MNTDELRDVLDLHGRWLREEADGVRANLRDAVLHGVNLHNANLRYANLRYADLSCADLRGTYMREAFLHCADLSRADLSGANLYDAYLYGANLSGADLSGVNLRYADLRGADLRGAVGRPAGIRWATHGPVGLNNTILTLYAPADQPTIVTGGCFIGTLDEFRDVVDAGGHSEWEWPDNKIGQYQDECRAAIALFERVAERSRT